MRTWKLAREKYDAGASTEDTGWSRLWRRGLDGLTSARQIERSTAEENRIRKQKSSNAGPNATSRRIKKIGFESGKSKTSA
jgi:hypothetical protein